jgi:sugar/nucleoside kinase (ribokinase family)
MDNKFDIIAIGDSTVDTFIKIHEATIECDINKKDCKICVNYGSKIPVESIAHDVAGNAANVAAGCTTLGLKTAIYTHLGNDWQGNMIKNQLEGLGINCDYVLTNKNKNSNLSVVLTYQGERTIFVYHQDWDYHLPKLVNSNWLYFTSLSQSFTQSNIVDEVAHYVDKSGAKLAFAPGTYQLKANVKRYKNTLERCQFFICNLEESKQILEIDKNEKVELRDLLDGLLHLGPKIIVITNGEEGSYATDGQQYLRIGVFPTKLVEKTGAGDSYACAFLAALSYNLPLAEAMAWGTVNAAHVVQKLGAQNGLLNRQEIERNRKAVSEITAISL